MTAHRVYDTPEWRRVRKAALARDRELCQIRWRGCLGKANTVDHIVELEDGGAPFLLENLQACCRPCNTAKRNAHLAARARRVRQMREW
jgi:5-methylcytosine-specific restriction protein A